MNNLLGLKISLCQMDVTPGKPDINANYVIRETLKAAKKGIDIIIFPEKCIPGYLIGDRYEDDWFINDIMVHNLRIAEATKGTQTIAMFGSTHADFENVGEDGRIRKFNAAMIAQNGNLLPIIPIKTLFPKYRFFDDSRHLFSTRQLLEENNEKKSGSSEILTIHDVLKPISLNTRIGKIKAGVTVCEDLWDIDYAIKPVPILIKNGSEAIISISASPWSWQKNRKRHQVVMDLLKKNGVLFIYVNNSGVQNTGKNIVVFDGNSTVYNPKGKTIFEIPAYEVGSRDLSITENMPEIVIKSKSDTVELFDAITHGTKGFAKLLPPQAPFIIGLSGGIDSAVTAALYTYMFGVDRVIGSNMPSFYNQQEGKDDAHKLAINLDIKYLVNQIQEITEAVMCATGAKPSTHPEENVLARVRGAGILATLAELYGGVFTANFNKVEAAFNYGTLYGDLGGWAAILGDLVKREVYQIGEHLNKVVFGREIIPWSTFDRTPSAELTVNQKDPFDYGNLERRGYHDEMVRAYTEFRKNPEWFLECYMNHTLEKELRLEPGRINHLFPTPELFIKDLEKTWTSFCASFKRQQTPPILIVSKRAFGTDYREAILPVHFTMNYLKMRKDLIGE